MNDDQRQRDRARAEAIGLAVDERRKADKERTGSPIEIAPTLEREAAAKALEFVVKEGSGLTELLDDLEELGKIRAAVQLLADARLTTAEGAARQRFDEAWTNLVEAHPRLFDRGAEGLLTDLDGAVQLLKLASGSGEEEA